MPHGRLVFTMNAPCEAVFDAFHHHELRRRWDSLVREPVLENGEQWPSVGAVTFNPGSGWSAMLSMRTQFVSFQRPSLAAAHMLGRSFPFNRWAASLKHEPLDAGRSLLIYTYNISACWYLRAWAEWAVHGVFRHETERRFNRLRCYLDQRLGEVQEWQHRNPYVPAGDAASTAPDQSSSPQ